MNYFFARLIYKRVTLNALIFVLGMCNINTTSQVWGETIEEQKARIEKLENEKKEIDLKEQIAKKKKAIAEAERDTAKAKREAAEASLPKINSSQAPKGSITTQGLTFENEVLAYRAMETVVGKIQAEIINKLGSEISLIVTNPVTNPEILPVAFAQLDYQIFQDRINRIKKNYQELGIISFQNRRLDINRNLPYSRNYSAITPNTAATASFLFDSLPFFRVDRELKETSVAIATRDFVAQLGGKLQETGNSKISIYYPAEYPLITKRAVNDVLKEINTLQELQRLAQKSILNLPYSKEANKLEQLNQSVEILLNELIDKNQNTAKNLFGAIASSRALQLILGSDRNIISNKTYFLSVEIISKGTQRITKTFLSNRLRHSGGVIVKYIIYDRNASIVLSNIHHAYTGFTKVRNSR
ncbi:MAG: hypothetical protein AAF378_12740 [Cyanobacteria bacterium P01_A01_bin.84]